MKKRREEINHPAHYNAGRIEVIDAIEDWKLGFSLGNAVKYIARAKHKGKELADLKKAEWYVRREINNAEKELAEANRKHRIAHRKKVQAYRAKWGSQKAKKKKK